MFSYNFDQKFEDIFEDNKYPKMVRLCHNYNNPGWTYNYHIHKDATEIVYIADGKAEYTIDMTKYILEKGQLLILEKGILHSIASDKKEPIDAWTCIINNYKLKAFTDDTRMLFSDMHQIISASSNENFIKSVMEEISFLCLQKTPSANFICNLLATSLVSVVFELLPKEKKSDRKLESSFIRDILIYIGEHYRETITIKQLSKIFHMSPGHISHSFAKEYGISPINYSIDLKMCEAKWLLINTTESLTSISEKIGYDNATHFTNMFIKRLNYSPLEYRKLFSSQNAISEFYCNV
ncbi:AraC family transcriptional regulator [Clostridium saccharoperbutylacetonicum]|uniref:AraC family transcriptional regulator n=1 Tax=Clostridium saccharoperbutylacetonicum TaxID=36745 RepID=UPI0039EA469E